MLAARPGKAVAVAQPEGRRLSTLKEPEPDVKEWRLPVQKELAPKRLYRLLDVYNDDQGWLRMTCYMAILSSLILLGVYFLSYEALNLNATAFDTQDMIKNYQQISRIKQQSFATLGIRLPGSQNDRPIAIATLNGESLQLSVNVDNRGGIGNPLLYSPLFSIPLLPGMSQTDFRATSLSGQASVRFPNPAADPKAQIAMSAVFIATFSSAQGAIIPVGGYAYATLPFFRITRNFDAGTVTAERLTSVRMRVLFDDLTFSWNLADTRGSLYGDKWTGKYTDLGQAFAAPGYTVKATIVDASLPLPPEFPAPSFTFRLYLGFFMVGLTFLAFWSITCLGYQLRRNSKENRGLPPLFFAGMTRFRGW